MCVCLMWLGYWLWVGKWVQSKRWPLAFSPSREEHMNFRMWDLSFDLGPTSKEQDTLWVERNVTLPSQTFCLPCTFAGWTFLGSACCAVILMECTGSPCDFCLTATLSWAVQPLTFFLGTSPETSLSPRNCNSYHHGISQEDEYDLLTEFDEIYKYWPG